MIESTAVLIREAEEDDAAGICDVFREVYGEDYAFPEFYEIQLIKRLIFGEDALMLSAIDKPSGRIIGTASVILEIGALSDLTGEFGRLAVLPDARGQRVGTMLMEARLAAVRDRLHAGIVDARVAHPYSLMIAQHHGFCMAGFSPLRHRFQHRESTCILAHWFGEGLSLRQNNPRIVAEAQAVASLALHNASLPVDVVIDDDAQPYPHELDFKIEELSTTGYSSLLRIERGRLRNREVFGPMRLHYGFFKLSKSHAHYLIAREGKRVAGAIGYIHDDHDRVIKVFELIVPDDRAVHFLFHELLRRSVEDWDIDLLEVDVRASSPRLQRTLLQLGFEPSAYIPAMVFHNVERYDVLRMTRLLVPPELGHLELTPEAAHMRDVVMTPFIVQHAEPIVQRALERLGLLQTMSPEQGHQLASAARPVRYEPGHLITKHGEPAGELLLVLEGEIDVNVPHEPGAIGRVLPGETIGELGLLGRTASSATAVTRTEVEGLAITHDDLEALIHRRPDIGLAIYRYLADNLAKKLRRMDEGQSA